MATHPDEGDAPPKVRRFVRFGASPRGAQALTLAGKVMALIRKRLHVAEEDIRDVAFAALRHRLVLNFEGEAEGLTGDDVLEEVMEHVAV
jgi:MoxR-like ATPase